MPKRLHLGLSLGLGMLGLWWGVLGSFGQEWPAIQDPAALRREATALCHGEGGWRELQPAEYPQAMLKLHPQSVSVSGERVYVALVPVAGGKRFHGYYIWPDTAVRSDGGIEREESDKADVPRFINVPCGTHHQLPGSTHGRQAHLPMVARAGPDKDRFDEFVAQLSTKIEEFGVSKPVSAT